jgi:hypothetical protein
MKIRFYNNTEYDYSIQNEATEPQNCELLKSGTASYVNVNDEQEILIMAFSPRTLVFRVIEKAPKKVIVKKSLLKRLWDAI